MNATDRYLKYVRWSDDDGLYVGYCPDLFPWGGVCHGKSEKETYLQLVEPVARKLGIDPRRQASA